MIKAKVERWGRYFLNHLETGEALLYSNPSLGGDGGWQWFPNSEEALAALAAGGLNETDSAMLERGTGESDESFVEQIRSAPGHKYYPLGAPWPDVAKGTGSFEGDPSKDN